jgi:peptidoglycan/LPS O-acetylase OafA/YrhL
MGQYSGWLTPPSGKQWAENIDDNYNNCFDFIRLALALLVVLYHCFYLAPNVDRSSTSFAIFAAAYNETGLPVDLGGLAVSGFFILSGFLITRSWDRTRSAPSYAAKRLMRIGPAFLVASLIGALLVAPITSAGVDHYFKDQHWLAIVANVLTFRPTGVGGAFVGNPTELLNGTLWSIRYEVDCYILVAMVGVFWFQAGRILIALAAVFSVLFVMDQWGYQLLPNIDHGIAYFLTSSPDEWPRWFSFFLAGSLFYVYRRHIPRSLIVCGVGDADAPLDFGQSVKRVSAVLHELRDPVHSIPGQGPYVDWRSSS